MARLEVAESLPLAKVRAGHDEIEERREPLGDDDRAEDRHHLDVPDRGERQDRRRAEREDRAGRGRTAPEEPRRGDRQEAEREEGDEREAGPVLDRRGCELLIRGELRPGYGEVGEEVRGKPVAVRVHERRGETPHEGEEERPGARGSAGLPPPRSRLDQAPQRPAGQGHRPQEESAVEVDPEHHQERKHNEPRGAPPAARDVLDRRRPGHEQQHGQEVRPRQPVGRRGRGRGQDRDEGDERMAPRAHQEAIEEQVGAGNERGRERHETRPPPRAVNEGPGDVREPLVGEPFLPRPGQGERVGARDLVVLEDPVPRGHVHGRVRIAKQALLADEDDRHGEEHAQQIPESRGEPRTQPHGSASSDPAPVLPAGTGPAYKNRV